MLVDTHAHLDFPEFAADLEAVLRRAKEAGVSRIVAIGTTLPSCRKAIKFAEQHPEIYAAVGVHPTSVSAEPEDFISDLRQLADHPKVVAIGETGLDYHRLPSSTREQEVSEAAFGAASTETIESDLQDDAEMASQLIAFEQQLELAATKSKNVVIHQRDAWDDTLKILRPYSEHVHGVFHCFNGSLEQAREAIDLGHYISFTGIVTFQNAEELRQVAGLLPSERIMVETDAPYLSPVPHRGKRCEPAFVRETAIAIAKIRNLTFETFFAQTTANAERFFGL
ncbi:MAG: TatD family hydrolase [Verrucomicrobia bacterium]|nr:TatD family hydrolase [Verrucomicrobiota bacterium]